MVSVHVNLCSRGCVYRDECLNIYQQTPSLTECWHAFLLSAGVPKGPIELERLKHVSENLSLTSIGIVA